MPAHRFLVAPVRLLLALALLLATMFTVGSHPATAVPGEDDSTAAAPGEPEQEPDLLDGLDGLAAGVEESDDPDQPAPKAAKPVKVKKSGGLGAAGKAAKKRAKAKARAAKRAAAGPSRALAVARRQIGDPYRYGAAGPNAFDCSGLVNFAFRAAGYKGIPRTSGAQASFSRRISRAALRPGDLMFFHSGGRVYHVGIFVGRKAGKVVMLHAPRSGDRVRYASPWTDSWFAGTVRRG